MSFWEDDDWYYSISKKMSINEMVIGEGTDSEEEDNREQCSVILDATCRSNKLIKFYRSLPILDSKLIDNFKYWQLFRDQLKYHKSKPQLLYRATRDTFSHLAFHEKCDNHLGVVIIVKSYDGDLFGGFTTKNLKSENNSPSIRDEESFTFRFEKNELHLFKLKPQFANYALLIYSSKYLFAFGYMFWIGENSNIDPSVSGTHPGIDDHIESECVLKGEKRRYFGGFDFKVEELEVFKILQ